MTFEIVHLRTWTGCLIVPASFLQDTSLRARVCFARRRFVVVFFAAPRIGLSPLIIATTCTYHRFRSHSLVSSPFIFPEQASEVIHFLAQLKHAPQENVPFVLPKVTCVSFISIAKANACYSCFSPTSFWPPTGNFRILNGIT